jgi:hypothetical protein
MFALPAEMLAVTISLVMVLILGKTGRKRKISRPAKAGLCMLLFFPAHAGPFPSAPSGAGFSKDEDSFAK